MPTFKQPMKRKKSDEVVIVTDLGRQQPQAIDFLEEVVIGACLIEQEAFGQIADILKPNAFYDSRHKLIFEAVQSLSAENKPIDILTVTDRLRKTGDIDAAWWPLLYCRTEQ